MPVKTCGGLPVLTPDLQWAPDVPLFVAGGLAALELGPTAQNLGGAREGAERIANRLSRLWDGLRRGNNSSAEAETEEDEELSTERWRAEEAERRAGNVSCVLGSHFDDGLTECCFAAWRVLRHPRRGGVQRLNGETLIQTQTCTCGNFLSTYQTFVALLNCTVLFTFTKRQLLSRAATTPSDVP